MFERNQWFLCSMYFSSPQSIWVVSLSWERKGLLRGKTLDPNQHNLSSMGAEPRALRGQGQVAMSAESLTAAFSLCFLKVWVPADDSKSGKVTSDEISTWKLSFSTAYPLSTPLTGASVHIKRVEQISEGTGEHFTTSYPWWRRKKRGVQFSPVSCPLFPGLVERMRWEVAGFPYAESAWSPQQLKWPGDNSHWPQGPGT